jgi:hypothetical protein
MLQLKPTRHNSTAPVTTKKGRSSYGAGSICPEFRCITTTEVPHAQQPKTLAREALLWASPDHWTPSSTHRHPKHYPTRSSLAPPMRGVLLGMPSTSGHHGPTPRLNGPPPIRPAGSFIRHLYLPGRLYMSDRQNALLKTDSLRCPAPSCRIRPTHTSTFRPIEERPSAD